MTVIDISQENVFPLMKVARALSKADNLNTQKILKEMTEKDTLHFPGGLMDYLATMLEDRATITPNAFFGQAKLNGSSGSIEWAVAWPKDEDFL